MTTQHGASCGHLEDFMRFWCPAQKVILDGSVARRC
jgi:hypothetical protein